MEQVYIRPVVNLATHIKSHSIPPADFLTLYNRIKDSCLVGLWTDYYDDKKIFSVIDTPTGRTYKHIEVLKTSLETRQDGSEKVVQYYRELPMMEFQNNYNHHHIRQKISVKSDSPLVLNEQMGYLHLEILLLGMKKYRDIIPADIISSISDVSPDGILSLSYKHILKT
jgi:hypothetical protein